MSKTVIAKRERANRRANRVRSRVQGDGQRPRLSVFRSLKHISAQLIDDTSGTTIVAAHDTEVKGKDKSAKAAEVGKLIAQRAKDTNITSAVFDRGSYRYHGRVKTLADAARESGLEF